MNDPRVYDTSQTLEAETTPQRIEVQQAVNQANAQMAVEHSAQMLASAIRTGKRAFVAPLHKNYRILVKAGPMGNQPHPNFPQGIAARSGDIWLTFTGGIAIIDPSTPEGATQLAWCEKHADKCRDAFEAETEAWSSLKEAQAERPDAVPSLSPSIDVDALMRGDYSSLSARQTLAARARAILEAEQVEES